MKMVEEFSQLNKDLKDRNDVLEIKKCQNCQILTSVDLEEEKMEKSESDDEHAKLYFLCKVNLSLDFLFLLLSICLQYYVTLE